MVIAIDLDGTLVDNLECFRSVGIQSLKDLGIRTFNSIPVENLSYAMIDSLTSTKDIAKHYDKQLGTQFINKPLMPGVDTLIKAITLHNDTLDIVTARYNCPGARDTIKKTRAYIKDNLPTAHKVYITKGDKIRALKHCNARWFIDDSARQIDAVASVLKGIQTIQIITPGFETTESKHATHICRSIPEALSIIYCG